LRWLSILFQIHGTEHAQQRLIKLMIMLGDFFGNPGPDGIVIEPRISQQDLASLLGVSRQWTNRTLTHLRNIGFVTVRDRRFVIQDAGGLKAMIGKT
jgi:CRP/FNR family transcriptional regulator